MATPSQDELAARMVTYLRLGDTLTKADNSGVAVQASSAVYADSSSKIAVLAGGGTPFAVKVSGLSTTAEAIMDFTGSSTDTANDLMHGQLVDGAVVTTFTKTGFLRVNITDNGGNIVNGQHYIQIGSLT